MKDPISPEQAKKEVEAIACATSIATGSATKVAGIALGAFEVFDPCVKTRNNIIDALSRERK